jgi:hypothetical protein
MLREFAELVSRKAGVFDWVTLVTVIVTMIQQCLDQPEALQAAIDGPLSWRQRLALNLHCTRAYGIGRGLKVSRVVQDNMKPYKDSKAGYGPLQFEEAVLREVHDADMAS